MTNKKRSVRHSKPTHSKNPLIKAVKDCNTSELKRLIEQDGYNPTTLEKPLLRTVWNGHKEGAKLFIEHGVNPENEHDLGMETPVHQAAHFNKPGVLSVLLNSGANVNPVDGDTGPMFQAISCANPKCLNILIKNGGTSSMVPLPYTIRYRATVTHYADYPYVYNKMQGEKSDSSTPEQRARTVRILMDEFPVALGGAKHRDQIVNELSKYNLISDNKEAALRV